jgi:hypothetical protein
MQIAELAPASLVASHLGTAHQIEVFSGISRTLAEIQIRMCVVARDRRTIRGLIHKIEADCDHIGTSERLDAVLTAAREHLELSEHFEEVEDRVHRTTLSDHDSAEELDPLLKHVYKSWLHWHTAQTRYAEYAAHLHH